MSLGRSGVFYLCELLAESREREGEGSFGVDWCIG